MKKILVIISAAIVAAACAAPSTNQPAPAANANIANEPASAAMSEADAIAKEKSAWEAIKNKDYDAFGDMLADDQIEVMGDAVNDKTASVTSVKDFEPLEVTFSDWKFLPVDKDAFVVTYTVTDKAKYKGKELPQETDRASSAWVRRAGKWLAIYHQECMVRPAMTAQPANANKAKASPAKAGSSPAAPLLMASTGPDPVANEKIVWDLFKSKNYDAFATLLAPDFIEVEPDKVYDKAGSVKAVSEFDASKAVLSDWKTATIDDKSSLVVYLAKFQGGPPDGERHATIWVNRDGKWLGLFHHGGTTVMKPPAMAETKAAASPSPKVGASPATKASPAMKPPTKKM